MECARVISGGAAAEGRARRETRVEFVNAHARRSLGCFTSALSWKGRVLARSLLRRLLLGFGDGAILLVGRF